MYIYMGEDKKLNYKKVILVVAIIIFAVACIYIGIILPEITDQTKENQNNQEQGEQNSNRDENAIQVILDNKDKSETPVREEKKTYPVIDAEGIERVKNIYHSDYKRVFLTFDDGPSTTVTPEILRILDEYNVKATFFVLGSRAELNSDLLKEEYNKGHFIANHGYSHKYSSIYAYVDNVLEEYRNTENIIRNALELPEYYSNVFRFPGGLPGGKSANLKKEAAAMLEKNNVAHLDWNCLSRDAEGSFDKDTLVQNVINTSQDKNSVVVLMHDAGNKKTTYEALPEIIEYFKNNGYVFENLYNILDGQ